MPATRRALADGLNGSLRVGCMPAATGQAPLSDPLLGLSELGATAANALSRAVARAIYEAAVLPFPGALPSWRERHSLEK